MSSHLFARFVHALWLGSGAFLIAVAAPAAFRAAPNSAIAGDVVGAMLSRWHYIALAAPLILLFLDWRRARVHVLGIVFIAIIFAAAQGMVDLRIRSMRASSPVPIGELDRQDPLRRAFGKLHGLSSVLMLAQIICAAVALGLDREAYPVAVSAIAVAMRKPESAEDTPIPAVAADRRPTGELPPESP